MLSQLVNSRIVNAVLDVMKFLGTKSRLITGMEKQKRSDMDEPKTTRDIIRILKTVREVMLSHLDAVEARQAVVEFIDDELVSANDSIDC